MKKKRIMLVSIFIILFLIMVITIILISLKKNENTELASTVEEDKKVIDSVKDYYKNVEGQIVPDNYNFLARMYEGNVSSNDIYKQIYMFVFVGMPEVNKELGENPSDELISEVYKQKENIISSYYGIETEDEFKEFIDKTANIKYEDFQNAIFTFDNYVENDEYTTLDLEIQYSNGNLSLQISIINQITEGKPSIKFVAK